MERKLLKKLKKWQASPERKPLILEGARQVGKTYLLKKFGEKNFDNVIYVNLERPDSDIDTLFATTFEPKKIVETLSLKYNVKIVPERTLIIFDEIQEKPAIMTALKYFAEEAPEYSVVVAGSLLGVAFMKGVSFPVGKVDRMRLYPLDFEEFCWAMGLKNQLEAVRKSIHQKEMPLLGADIRDAFQQYLAVGGMPAAVFNWAINRDIEAVDRILKNILADYRDDFGKHATATEAEKIMRVWSSVPIQFAKENHKFIYKAIRDSARGRDYEFALGWLKSAGLTYGVSLVARGDRLPLKAYSDMKDFKLYMLDVGLMRALAGLPSSVVVGEDDIWSQFGGAFAEQYVLQQLLANGMEEAYYWTGGADNESAPKARSEVDFIVSSKEKIIPIEVKSGTNVKAKSLKVYRKKYEPSLSVRFSLLGLDYNEGLLNLPLFYSFLFEEFLMIGAKNTEELMSFHTKSSQPKT